MANVQLDPKHERFCREYVIDYNQTQAAIRAGYAPKSAHVQGSVLMDRIDVMLRVEQLKLEVNTELKVTRERVIEEFARIGLSDIRKVFAKGTRSLEDVQNLDDATAAAIESIEVIANTEKGEVVDYTHKIKLASKVKALENLGKHFNIYEDHQKSSTGEIHVHIEGKDAGL